MTDIRTFITFSLVSEDYWKGHTLSSLPYIPFLMADSLIPEDFLMSREFSPFLKGSFKIILCHFSSKKHL